MGEVFETMALYVEHNLDGFCVCVCVLYSCRSFIDSSSFFFLLHNNNLNDDVHLFSFWGGFVLAWRDFK